MLLLNFKDMFKKIAQWIRNRQERQLREKLAIVALKTCGSLAFNPDGIDKIFRYVINGLCHCDSEKTSR